MHTSIPEKNPLWYAIKTQYRSEKKVSAILSEKGIQNYVPLVQIVRQYKSRIKKHLVPLIKCYVFVKITRHEYIPVLETANVLGFVTIGREISSVRNEEIEMLKLITGEDIPVSVVPSEYHIGQKVQIVSGLLTGLKGIIVGKKNRFFTLQLPSIGYDILIDPKYLTINAVI